MMPMHAFKSTSERYFPLHTTYQQELTPATRLVWHRDNTWDRNRGFVYDSHHTQPGAENDSPCGTGRALDGGVAKPGAAVDSVNTLLEFLRECTLLEF